MRNRAVRVKVVEFAQVCSQLDSLTIDLLEVNRVAQIVLTTVMFSKYYFLILIVK